MTRKVYDGIPCNFEIDSDSSRCPKEIWLASQACVNVDIGKIGCSSNIPPIHTTILKKSYYK
jgi:hypothetical protein